MPYIMEQCGKAQVFCVFAAQINLVFTFGLQHSLHDAQCAKRMHETRMCGVGVGDLAHLQLLDMPESLERRGIHDVPLTFSEMDVPVYGVYDESIGRVRQR